MVSCSKQRASHRIYSNQFLHSPILQDHFLAYLINYPRKVRRWDQRPTQLTISTPPAAAQTYGRDPTVKQSSQLIRLQPASRIQRIIWPQWPSSLVM